MVLWIMAGYLVTAAAFYSYIVATAKEEPAEHALSQSGADREVAYREEPRRKAA